MGRKINAERREEVLEAVTQNDGELRSSGVARLLDLHPQEVARVLTALEDEPQKHLCEDDRGFLSLFKK